MIPHWMEKAWLKFELSYRRLFSIEEIEGTPILQWMFGAMLFYFFVTFYEWIGRTSVTVEAAKRGTAVCWPYFKNCTDLYFLHVLPYGYSQTTLYMCFYGMMMLIVYLMWRKMWVRAHMLLALLFAWKVFVMFFLNYTISGPYDYYHIFLTATLLFVPHKEYFLKLLFVFFYFMSVTVKFTPAWIVGTYFTSMTTGAPLMPSWLVAIAGNIVIFGQIVECWFLLSRNWLLQRISLSYALFFHLYSGIIVMYNYPSITLPAIAILFGPMYRYTSSPFKRTAIPGWCIVALVGLFQLSGFVIPTDRYLTLEGNRFGMFMFEANHQCIVSVEKHYQTAPKSDTDFESPAGTACQDFYCQVKRKTTTANGSSTVEQRYESSTAWNRCDPYQWWSQLHTQCNSTVDKVWLTFDHSINGGPFYRIVDRVDICSVEYAPFSHNPWILLPPEAKIQGYPVQNWYRE